MIVKHSSWDTFFKASAQELQPTSAKSRLSKAVRSVMPADRWDDVSDSDSDSDIERSSTTRDAGLEHSAERCFLPLELFATSSSYNKEPS